MSDNKNNSKSISKKSIFISIAILIVVVVINIVDIDLSKLLYNENDIERVRKKMKKELKEKYNEPFVVKDIGTRSDDGGTEYVARIYPKSIVGTKKEYDTYYHGSATLDKVNGGLDDEIGDDYSYITRNISVEKYLQPEVKNQFGKRTLMKVKVEHKVTADTGKGGWWAGYKSKSLQEMRDSIKADPNYNRIELTLYLYIFDRIDSKQEKEKRRKDIFGFVQYLKEEGLFRYLEMGVIFIDERVLAPSYEEYEDKMYNTEWVTREIQGEGVELPPDSFRTVMSKSLQSELDTMSEKHLIGNMEEFRKCNYRDIEEYNCQKATYIYSWDMLKEEYPSSIEGRNKNRDYSKLEHVKLGNNLKYIYK